MPSPDPLQHPRFYSDTTGCGHRAQANANFVSRLELEIDWRNWVVVSHSSRVHTPNVLIARITLVDLQKTGEAQLTSGDYTLTMASPRTYGLLLLTTAPVAFAQRFSDSPKFIGNDYDIVSRTIHALNPSFVTADFSSGRNSNMGDHLHVFPHIMFYGIHQPYHCPPTAIHVRLVVFIPPHNLFSDDRHDLSPA